MRETKAALSAKNVKTKRLEVFKENQQFQITKIFKWLQIKNRGNQADDAFFCTIKIPT